MTMYPEDAPVAELCTAELFLVTMLRLWGESVLDGIRDDRLWRDGFAAAGFDDRAAATFHSLVLLAKAGARRPLDIRRRHNPRLGGDEARFLRVVGLLQHGDEERSEYVLREFLAPAATRVAMPFVSRLAAAMSAARLNIPQRPDEVALRHYFDAGDAKYRGLRVLNLIH